MGRWATAGLASANLVVLLLLGSPARATVGGPRSIEVLGHEPGTGVVWMLEHDGSESGEPPRVLRLPTRGARPRMPEEAPHDPPAELAPLVRLPATEARVRIECDATGDARGNVWGRQLVPRPVRLHIARGGCAADVHDLYLVPGTTHALAIVRYVGIEVEGGYDLDRPVLVRYRPPRGRISRTQAGGDGVRVRLEAPIDERTGRVERLDLVTVDPDGETHRVRLAWWPGECDAFGTADVRCGAARYEAALRGRVAEARRDGVLVARAHLPRGAAVEAPVFAFAHAMQWEDDGAEARAVCAADRDCRIVTGAATVVFEPMRGMLRCDRRDARLACLWEHTTNRYLQRLWRVDLQTRRARTVWEPRPASMEHAVEGPAWTDRGIRLGIEGPDGALRDVVVGGIQAR